MTNTKIKNASKVFSKIIFETQYEDLDSVLLERMKIRIVDSIGVTFAGAHGVGVDAVLALMRSYGGVEEASIIGHGEKLPALNAAMVNSVQMRSNDFEPCHADNRTGEGSPSHIASCLNPTAFAVGEREKASGKEVMTAMAVGDDFGCRLNDAMGFSVYNIFDGTGTVNGMAACACAAKLGKLTEEQIHNAFGIAVNCIGGTMASTLEGSWLFKFPTSNAARNGIFSSDLAKNGYQGIDDPIAGTRGFFDMFGTEPDLDKFFYRAGEKYYGEVLIKPYAGCCATHQAIKATLLATDGKAYKPSEIKEIRCHMLESKVGIVGGLLEQGEISQPKASFSIQSTVCNAVLHGGVYPEHESLEALASDDFQGMIKKYIQIPDITDQSDDWAYVEIDLKDGTVLSSRYGKIRPGMMTGKEPLDLEYIRNKYIRNFKYGGKIPLKRADEIWEICMNLEQLDSFSYLSSLLVP